MTRFYAYYLREIARPKCRLCPKYATHTLMNSLNAPCGDYCQAHAKQKIQQLKAELAATVNQ